MLARHVSNLIGPSLGASFTSCIRRLVCGTTVCTTRHVQPLRSGWTCRVVRVLPHTKVCEYSLYKTCLMMDRWGPKHVELTYVMNKLAHWITLCILLDCKYITRWYTVPTISNHYSVLFISCDIITMNSFRVRQNINCTRKSVGKFL